MKLRTSISKVFLFITLCSLNLNAQDFNQHDYRWAKGWTNFEPNKTNYPEAEEKLPNVIADNTFLRNDIVYLLSGDVYVIAGATLTIQEGTVIRCDHENPANLIVTKGSKLIAAGSQAYPIVFTSNKAPKSRNSGDWGGITIAGSGNVNTVSGSGIIKGNYNPQYSIYGGTDTDEQTTILRYVRIEFAGNKNKRAEGANGLSLYGVGSSSIIDNIMVSYSAQDSYSINGGKIDILNLISLKAEDDDFQISEGYKGDLDNLMAIRHPYITSPKGSYALEVNGFNKDMGYTKPNALTNVTVTNATLVNLSDKSNYAHTSSAISATNAAMIYINNSKISGFSDVVKFDKSYTSLAFIAKAFTMDNSFFNIHSEGVKVDYKPSTGVLDILKYNRFTKDFVAVNDLFNDPQSKVMPKFQLKQSLNKYMVMQ
ncbi:hypothetical protein [Aquimarina sp. MMG016]|uniref:hypothetical protein n=1 Tax=Aquimarina sp. MMG016 TaxID=2822690 RepID=UPI001B3A3B15|nr:hypothetical protein [Aquimarina sp. MMG016]MBQ4818632.1 hypothetical protein [Aquimarina sp. MMG016]